MTAADPGVYAAQLPGHRQAAGDARLFVTRMLAECPAHLVRDAELCADELVVNAVKHSRSGDGGTIGLSVAHCAEWVRVQVSDAGAETTKPKLIAAAPDAESGRGLRLVDALAARWGVEEAADGIVTVWFELDLPGDGEV